MSWTEPEPKIMGKQWEILGTSSGDFRCISRDCPGAGNKNREPSIATRRRTSSGKTVLTYPEVAEEAVGGPQSCKWLSWGLQGTAGGCLEGHPHWVSQESAPAGHAGISPSSSAVHLILAKTSGGPQRVRHSSKLLLHPQGGGHVVQLAARTLSCSWSVCSRCQLKSSTLCLEVLDAFFRILSICSADS
ncbi:LOW QUALITY PROTEIN: uncharacterized protein LOC111522960 [Piliocolobus tephrosceles]|uniref:LOW QUALITY PROTEIN: uncharacterized protein LOC111522960 n=1 Tax=Piliocolobus tephrosceles TaxID=591936 RepID=UPI000C2B1A15|nr:LOW QUALITY PROTEIN: uncharacterized protein LOC111522960 [Piliocolobus tephrosceles]